MSVWSYFNELRGYIGDHRKESAFMLAAAVGIFTQDLCYAAIAGALGYGAANLLPDLTTGPQLEVTLLPQTVTPAPRYRPNAAIM